MTGVARALTRRSFVGTTVEGLPCEFAVEYLAGSVQSIVGSYFAHDSLGEDGHRIPSYFSVDRVEDLPWVVHDGQWEPQR